MSVFVHKWVVYDKYGIGYILSDGMTGTVFNDGVKILSIDQKSWTFVTRVTSEGKNKDFVSHAVPEKYK